MESVETSVSHLCCHWTDGHVSNFYSIWLRQNCHCSSCRQPISGQRLVRWGDIPETLTFFSSSRDQDTVKVTFTEDTDHVTVLPISFLRDHDCSPLGLGKMGERRTPRLASKLSEISWKEVEASDEGLWRLLSSAMDDGVCIIKGVPTEKDYVVRVGRTIGPILSSIYPEVFDVSSSDDGSGNVAYSTAWLPLHQDIPYVGAVPGLQLLHCMRFDECVEGGENYLVDTFEAAETLRISHPQHFDTLTRVPATFQMLKEEGAGVPTYLRYQRPHIVVNNRKEVIGFNWSPNQEGPLVVAEEDVEPFYAAYRVLTAQLSSAPRLELRQRPGDVVLFNNRRMLHSRAAFTLHGGARHLQGCYVGMGDFLNRYALLAGQYGAGVDKLGKRVGDLNYM